MAINIEPELSNIQTAVYGESVRKAIHDAIQKIANQCNSWIGMPAFLNTYDYLTGNAEYQSRTSNGVTFTWDGSHSKCTASGNASGGVAATYLFNNTSGLLPGIVPGETYYVSYTTTNPNLAFAVGYYRNGEYLSQDIFTEDGTVTIPSNCTGMYVRIHVANGSGGTGVASKIALSSALSNSKMSEEIRANSLANKYGKMRSFINSILYGSVHNNGVVTHASYDNAPYGLIAKALGIPENNVINTFIGGTGLLYDAGSGNFLSKIRSTSLAGFDYLLTMFWINDLECGYNLGTINDSSSSSTLAGAVVNLVEYMRSSNGLCHLILVGPPPVSATSGRYGNNVFTANYGRGFSIHDVNVLMQKMAEKYHFTYISWENMALSYYYHNYTDVGNVHPKNEATFRSMGEYLGRNI